VAYFKKLLLRNVACCYACYVPLKKLRGIGVKIRFLCISPVRWYSCTRAVYGFRPTQVNYAVAGSIQVNNRQLLKVEVCVVYLNVILPYLFPAEVFLRPESLCLVLWGWPWISFTSNPKRDGRRCFRLIHLRPGVFFSGVGLTSPGTAATSSLLYSPRW
jgi:hypothetical protein